MRELILDIGLVVLFIAAALIVGASINYVVPLTL